MNMKKKAEKTNISIVVNFSGIKGFAAISKAVAAVRGVLKKVRLLNVPE